jgi:chemotaxis protein CheX
VSKPLFNAEGSSMDVKYINPFLNGTIEVLKKMAFIDAVPGKPHVKQDEIALGDVSGVIGITGDALGSLALSFSEKCICKIASNMLGEEFLEVTRDIIDAAGEITNMISGASRTQMEKMGMSVYAAIPTVVHGHNHTITHILKSPSIVIPFSTSAGSFVVDVCIRTVEESEKSAVHYGVVSSQTPLGSQPDIKAATARPVPARSQAAPVQRPEEHAPLPPQMDIRPNAQGGLGKPLNFEEVKEGAAGKLESLKAKLKEMNARRNAIMEELSSKPFMELAKRQKLKKEIPLYDKKIQQIKMDILGLEMVAKMSLDDIENPKTTKHYQNYDDKQKR